MKDNRFDVVKENDCNLVVPKTITPTKDGHIRLRMHGELVMLHRYVYEENFGKIPDGLVVRHKCDNPNCINPEHLELGTHADNVRDRVERDRSAKGEGNGRTKLTEEQARFIKYDENHNNSELSRMFNVSTKAIRLIKQGVNWKHI
ncbi:HNH endonuclease [Bacillus phage vB_BanS-Thrax3]|nr:HNH endonuclease [Bacillus phage vB_BanS-Thrax3]